MKEEWMRRERADAYSLQQLFNLSINHLLRAMPGSATKYAEPESNLGKVLVERSNPSKHSDFVSSEYYERVSRFENGLAHITYTPLELVQEKIHREMGCLRGFEPKIHTPRRIIIGDLRIDDLSYALREDWHVLREEEHEKWNAETYKIIKENNAGIVVQVMQDTRQVMRLLGLREVNALRAKKSA